MYNALRPHKLVRRFHGGIRMHFKLYEGTIFTNIHNPDEKLISAVVLSRSLLLTGSQQIGRGVDSAALWSDIFCGDTTLCYYSLFYHHLSFLQLLFIKINVPYCTVLKNMIKHRVLYYPHLGREVGESYIHTWERNFVYYINVSIPIMVSVTRFVCLRNFPTKKS